MKRLAVIATIVLTIGAILVGTARTAPKPSEVSNAWQLDIDYKAPQPIMIQVPGEAKPRLFWFMQYTVTNHAGQDQIFVPEFTLFTDTAQVIKAGQRVPAGVFDKIKSLYNNPLLNDVSTITGKILQGDDNAKDGVAIWSDFDPKATSFDVFVGGLSGETAQITLPQPMEVTEVDSDGKKVTKTVEKVVLSKTLDLSYTVNGDPDNRAKNKAGLTAKNWVMR